MSIAAEDLSRSELVHLRRYVDLAAEALAAGDEPFGSVLVDASGTAVFEDRNRIAGGDSTRHPEFEIARWAAAHLDPQARAEAVTFTSGEHCPMCSAAHAWVGLGPIVYVSSTQQLRAWHAEWGIGPGPVTPLAIEDVAPGIDVRGPVDGLAEEVRALHARLHGITD